MRISDWSSDVCSSDLARNFFPQFSVNPQRMFDTYPEWVLPPAQRRAFISTPNGAIAGRVLAERFGWKVGDRIPLTSFIWTLADGSRAWEWELVGIFDGRDEQWSERANQIGRASCRERVCQ